MNLTIQKLTKTEAQRKVLQEAATANAALQAAVSEALDRKRRLGQYWVIWDGEKPVEVCENVTDRPAAE